MELAALIKQRRKALKLTQPELALKAGVGLRFVRELEQGKSTLRMDKVNQVLQLFGFELGPVAKKRMYSPDFEHLQFMLNEDSTDLQINPKPHEKR